MSDNFDVTQGAGKTIRAVDNNSAGILYQVVSVGTVASAEGPEILRMISANSTNAISVKGAFGNVYGWDFYNTNAAVRWLKLYNKASAPTVGTDVPVMTIALKPGDHSRMELTYGLPFSVGIALALTTGVADADTGAVGANEITGHLFLS